MTPEDRDVIAGLVFVPGRGREGAPEDVLRHFGATDGHALGLRLLRDAVDRQDGSDVAYALIVCGAFGITMDHFELLLRLASADWHHSHEDVVSDLGRLRSSAAVDALYHAASRVPGSLAWDENRALAVKAIWALGGTPGAEAGRALELLLEEPDEIVRRNARQQLARRGELAFPEHLEPALALLRRAFPAGVPDRDYLPLLVVLLEDMPEDDMSIVAARLTNKEYLVVEKDAAAAVSMRKPDPDDVQRARALLESYGWVPDDSDL